MEQKPLLYILPVTSKMSSFPGMGKRRKPASSCFRKIALARNCGDDMSNLTVEKICGKDKRGKDGAIPPPGFFR
jgi:hypothetical protein